MNGKEVYKFATREVPKVIKEALVAADMEVEDVDWLLLHQVSSLPHVKLFQFIDSYDLTLNLTHETFINTFTTGQYSHHGNSCE